MGRDRLALPVRASLARLALAAQRDEPRALDALLEAIRPTFARYFSRRVSRDAAEDLTQAALIRTAHIVNAMHAGRVAQHLGTIARAVLQQERLQRAREERRAAAAPLGESVPWPVDLAREAERDELVRAVIRVCTDALPPELRAVIPAVLGERTVAELAADTGLDPVTLRVRLVRARAILRRELGSHVER